MGGYEVVDDASPAALASADERSTKLAQSTAAGDEVASEWISHQFDFQFQDICFGEDTRGGLFEGGKTDEFHVFVLYARG